MSNCPPGGQRWEGCSIQREQQKPDKWVYIQEADLRDLAGVSEPERQRNERAGSVVREVPGGTALGVAMPLLRGVCISGLRCWEGNRAHP